LAACAADIPADTNAEPIAIDVATPML
jgi:hypothetical protein